MHKGTFSPRSTLGHISSNATNATTSSAGTMLGDVSILYPFQLFLAQSTYWATHQLRPQYKLTAKMPQIHWTAPTLMISSLIVGTLFALGHHLFYASLNRKEAPTSLSGYEVLGTHISFQQLNTAVGTAFAFLVRACLMLSSSVAYFQILIWSVAKYGTGGTKLAHLDVMTSALQDLVSLMSFKTWWRRLWLWGLVVLAWYAISGPSAIQKIDAGRH